MAIKKDTAIDDNEITLKKPKKKKQKESEIEQKSTEEVEYVCIESWFDSSKCQYHKEGDLIILLEGEKPPIRYERVIY